MDFLKLQLYLYRIVFINGSICIVMLTLLAPFQQLEHPVGVFPHPGGWYEVVATRHTTFYGHCKGK